MSRKNSSFNFEHALLELEQVVTTMESGKLSLEDSLQHFEKGVALIRECQKKLKDSEQKVKILLGEKTLATYNDKNHDNTNH